MKTAEVYKRFLLKINKNDSNEGANILASAFVLQFNTEAVRWLGETLRDEADNVKIETLDRLLETDVELVLVKNGTDSDEFKLPDDFYRHASSFSIVDKGDCKGVKIINFDKKPLNFTVNLADDFNKPAFDFEETPFIVTKGNMKVYFDDFEIKKVVVSYYRIPKSLDLVGYFRIDGTPSTDVDTDLSDENIDEVLNRLAAEFNRQFQDSEGLQYSKDRIGTEP